MADRAHDATDGILGGMERHLSAIYRRAGKEISKTAEKYFKDFARMDAAKLKLVQSGAMSADEYMTWRKNKILYSRRFGYFQKEIAEQLLHVNEIAVDYINDRLPEVYALNYNALKGAVKQIKGYSFTLCDANTVKRLATIYGDLLPKKKMDPKKDIPWNMKKVQSEVLQGIIQGDSIPKIAKRMRKVEGMNQESAVRAARTSVTGAECRGRMDSYRRAKDDGIKIKKVWMATLDGRTRHEHRMLDGQKAEIDKPFKVDGYEIMYPGDPTAPPFLVYNCRCTTVADTGVIDEPWVPTGTVVDGMSYEEWQKWRRVRQ